VDTRTQPPSTAGPKPGRRFTFAQGLGVGVAIAVVAIAFVVFLQDNGASASTVAARQATSLRASCQRWTDSSAPALRGTSARSSCTAMNDWMRGELRDGRMSATAMWGDSTSMRNTCLQWASTTSAGTASADAQPWCAAMAARMGHDIGDWQAWMMNGRMMRP
jgi:hypothetical protein